MTGRNIYQGETVPFAINFKQGTDESITDFLVFDEIKIQVKTISYPLFDLEVFDVQEQAITGEITAEITSKLQGNLLVLFTFVKDGKTYKNKVATTYNILPL